MESFTYISGNETLQFFSVSSREKKNPPGENTAFLKIIKKFT